MGLGKRKSVQLATRIPAELRRRAKLAAIASDLTLQDYVIAAIEEKLARERAEESDGASGAPGGRRQPLEDDACWRVPPTLLMQVG